MTIWKPVALACLALALTLAPATTAMAGLSYSGPTQAVQTSGTLSSASLGLTCDLSVEGEIDDPSWPVTGTLQNVDFTDCRFSALPFIVCSVSVSPSTLDAHATQASDETLHLVVDTAFTVTRICPIMGTCEYGADGLEGIFNEHSSNVVLTNQPLTGLGGCANATWNADFSLEMPSSGLHWDKP